MINKFRTLGVLLGGALFLGSCASKSGDVQDGDAANLPVVISKVEMTNSESGSQLVVHANKEPKYNVFKLMDPERVVVDVIDAKLGEEVASQLEGNELVKEVKVQALEDSLSALVRMEIILNTSANYLAEVTNDGMVLRLLRVGDELKETPKDVPQESAVPMAAAESPAPIAAPEIAIPEKSSEVNVSPATPDLSASIPAMPVPVPVQVAPMPSASPEPTQELKFSDIVKTEPVPVVEEKPLEPIAEVKPEAAVEAQKELELPVAETIEKKKLKMKKGGNEFSNLKPVANQEIPSVLTEGTSLLTELDSKVYTGRRVSLEFQDADVQDILKLIADVSKLNIVTGDDVKGKLTLKLVDVPWDQALDIILTTLGLDKTQHGNIIRVAPSEKLRKEREVALANDKAAKQLEPLKLKLINVNYAKADDLSSRIKNLLSDRGTIDTDTRTNTLIVKDIKEHLSRVENLIRALDTQTPQVRIEARIVQADDQFSRNLGIQWGPVLHLDDTNSKQRNWQFPHSISAGAADSAFALPTYAVDAVPGAVKGGGLGFRLGSVSSIFNLDLKLQYLEQESLGRVVSRPSISVLDNKQASIIQGSKVPYLSSSSNGTSVAFQDVGIQISVTPQITSDGSVILKVKTSSNEILDTSVGGNPITTIREANTEMLVKSGRTAVLGGVFKTSDGSAKGGVPGLYKLPIIGWLFGSNSTTTKREETLVFITPYILNDSRVANATPNSETDIDK